MTTPTLAEDGIIQLDDGTLELIRVVPITTAVGYGVDLVCIEDLDPALKVTNPFTTETLAQDCYHRITTRRGTLPDDADFGIDIAAFLHAPKTPADLKACEGQIATELQKDDRVREAFAVVTFDGRKLSVSVRVTPEDPDASPFSLIIAVTDGAILLLEVTS
jgi:hypothetical protein